MKKRVLRAGLLVILCLLRPVATAAAQKPSSLPSPGDQSASAQDTPEEETAIEPGQVMIDGRTVLKVYEPIASLTLDARAEGIASRIVGLARDTNIPAQSVRLQPRDLWTEILAKDTVIMAVTDADARTAGMTRQDLALKDAESIRQAIRTYRQEHSWRMLLRAILKTTLTTLILLALLWLVRRLRLFCRARIQKQIAISAKARTKSAWHLSMAYLGPVILALGTFLRWVVILALLEAFLTVTLGFYSSTRELSLTATKWILSQLELLAKSGLDYVPNLLVLAVIVLLTYYILRLIKLVFAQISKGDLRSPVSIRIGLSRPTNSCGCSSWCSLWSWPFPTCPGREAPRFRGFPYLSVSYCLLVHLLPSPMLSPASSLLTCAPSLSATGSRSARLWEK